MAIAQNSNFLHRVSNPNPNFLLAHDAMSTSDDSDCSTMELDNQDSLNQSEARTEQIQLGNDSFFVPIELYDLENLSSILNISNWNDLLSENERFGLCKHLPDMEKEIVSGTLVQLFSGGNFHFGSPIVEFFKKLKGGEFEPGVGVYRKSLKSFNKRKYYHNIRKYHDSMVNGFFRIKGVWEKYKGCGVEERLRVLNIMKSRNKFVEGNVKGYALTVCKEENDSSRVTEDAKPQLVKRLKEFGDGKRKVSNEVTIASYSGESHDNIRSSKFYDKDWMYSTKVQSQNLPTQYPLKSDGTNINNKKLKMQEVFNSHNYKLGSDSRLYSARSLKTLKEKKVKTQMNQAETMDMGYPKGRAVVHQIEEIESDSSDHDKKYAYTDLNGGLGFDQPRTVRSVYNPIKVNGLIKNGDKSYFLGLKNETNIHAPEIEPYLKKKAKVNAPTPFKTNYSLDYSIDHSMDVSAISYNGHMKSISSRNQVPVTDSSLEVLERNHDRDKCMPLLGCNTMAKKHMATSLLIDDTQDSNILGKETLDDELDIQLQKKPYIPITPTVHTGFSFSIVHLLTAIRKAMVDPEIKDEQCLTVKEIANRVKSNPEDPCILETQELLHDLIRGALKIFASKTAPLGAKGWKALVTYEKSKKSWSWVGPISSATEEETSPEAWGIPYKMLLSLVNAFANWLKKSQETLKQIGSLPPPPFPISNLDEKERFKDLKTQKNPMTISQSSDEQRAYFRKEEFLRYSVPDRAFSYTAFDGKKSGVAPITRGAGKPASKARDHFMLKLDRPPYVTVRCVVRDAAARLPGSIGTRADVCTLLRDSQYIVEDITHAQLNQVVSGALDRLHSEVDPCIHFDQERKLWVYLHQDREEEDFEDDGTSSTKNWKKPRKGAVVEINDAESGFDLNSDVKSDSSIRGKT